MKKTIPLLLILLMLILSGCSVKGVINKNNNQPVAKAQGKILNGESIKFADKDFTLFYIEPITYGLAMYYSADQLNFGAEMQLIINQYSNNISAKDLASGITGQDSYSGYKLYKSFTASDNKNRESYYIISRNIEQVTYDDDPELSIATVYIIKVFEDNGLIYSLIFEQKINASSNSEVEKLSDQWVIDNLEKYGGYLDGLDIADNIEFYNQNRDIYSGLSKSNKYSSLKWQTKTIKEKSKYTDIEINYPQFIGGTEVVKLNSLLKKIFTETIVKNRAEIKDMVTNGNCWTDDSGKQQCSEDRWRCRDIKEFNLDCGVDLYSEFEIISVINDIVSIKLVLTNFTGGGLGNHSGVTIINYDLKNDQELKENQLFCKQDYLNKLAPIARAGVYAQKDIPAYYMSKVDLMRDQIDDNTNSSSEYFGGISLGVFGVTVYFQPYIVGSGAEGIIEAFIPYSDLIGDICFPEVASQNNFLPLSRGSYWLYRVTGETQCELTADGKEIPVIKTDKQVKVEVLNYVRRDSNIQAALLTGYPGLSEGTSTLVVVANNGYHLFEGDWAFNRILDRKDDLTDLYSEYSLRLPLPLTINKKFGCDEESMNRKDNYYCYWVESIKPADASIFPNKNQYQISYYTLPDFTRYYYVDGVGVTYATYHHNGSLNDERWNLVKYFIK